MDEKRQIQLKMLQEIDCFCRANSIRYSLSSGTLIGAIRHKGFIPWDDDLDITMPLPDMLRFKKEFHSDNIKFCDIETVPHYFYPFPRLADTSTYSIRNKKKTCGVCIDLYVVVGLSDEIQKQNDYFNKAMNLFKKRVRYKKYQSIWARLFPSSIVPGFDQCVAKYTKHLLENSIPYQESKQYYRIASAQIPSLIKKNTLDFDFFDNLLDLPFEGYLCKCTGHYHEYLTQRYGDYMQLPPESQRKPYHGGVYYKNV